MTEEIESHILARFQIQKKIGEGAYGRVWKVVDKKTRQIKALKKNFDAFNNSTDAQRTYREIMFLMQLSHPNIIKLEEIIKSENNKDIYLVFEHMDIDLYTLIREGILAEKHKKYILYQLAKSMYYLHTAGLIHRDIKPSNVLVNQNCQAKICDFGLVRSVEDQIDENFDILTQYIATRWYRAPEILLGSKKYTKSIDIWSFGCLLAEMQRGKPLFPGTSTMNQIEKVLMWTGMPSQSEIKSLKLLTGQDVFKHFAKIRKISKKQLLPNITLECLDMIEKCLEFNPDKRLTIDQILEHPYLADFYKKQELIPSKVKVKVDVDDNQRLNLKEYRNLIYEEIKKKNKTTIQANNLTLYRIKNLTNRKNSNKLKDDPFEEYTQKKSHQNKKILEKYEEVNHQKIEEVQHYKNSSEIRTSSLQKEEDLKKKTLFKKQFVTTNKGRHLKTIEKEWNPPPLKKNSFYQKESKEEKQTEYPVLMSKEVKSKYDWNWNANTNKKKRSTTEGSHKVNPMVMGNPVDLKTLSKY